MQGSVPGSDPYPWPYDGALDGPRLALVVAGAQRRWVEGSTDVAAVAAALERLAGSARRAGARIVLLQHVGPGEDVDASGVPVPGPVADAVIKAVGLDGFYGSRLDADLRAAGVDRLFLGGFGLEGPVHSTLRGANDRGYECLTLADACAPVDPTCREAALKTITMSGGIFGAVGTTDAVCEALDEAQSGTHTPHEHTPQEKERCL